MISHYRVGNVPSDASHSELWQFFVSRPSPSAVGMLSNEDIDLSTPGVESIHLIARSNCMLLFPRFKLSGTCSPSSASRTTFFMFFPSSLHRCLRQLRLESPPETRHLGLERPLPSTERPTLQDSPLSRSEGGRRVENRCRSATSWRNPQGLRQAPARTHGRIGREPSSQDQGGRSESEELSDESFRGTSPELEQRLGRNNKHDE